MLYMYIYIVFSFVSGQLRSWSDYADAQADLGLRCLLMALMLIFVWRGSVWFTYSSGQEELAKVLVKRHGWYEMYSVRNNIHVNCHALSSLKNTKNIKMSSAAVMNIATIHRKCQN